MTGGADTKLRRVAIVGVEGSGKTVMLAGLGDLYKTPDDNGWLLEAKNFATFRYVQGIASQLCAGRWPEATASDTLHALKWTLRRSAGPNGDPKDVGTISFLDFPGEAYRAAFGITAVRPETKSAVEQLQRHVVEAGLLVVLVNLRDVIVNGLADEGVQEAMWITSGILAKAFREVPYGLRPRVAIVLSQADSYADTIRACGGPRQTLARYLPEVAANYSGLDVLALASIDKTDLDDEGSPRPAKGFTFKGLVPLMDWIVASLQSSRPWYKERWKDALLVVRALCGSLWHRAKQTVVVPHSYDASASRESLSIRRTVLTKIVTLPGGIKLELVWCPSGSFLMGSPRGILTLGEEVGRDSDETQHWVTLSKGFWLGKYPVTQGQWKSVMGSNPSHFKGDRRPVEQVSWDDCQKFCKKVGLGLRLPTEAEWEYACRAGTETAYFWGNVLNGDRANCNGEKPCGTTRKGSYKKETTPVGVYGANDWGFYDMHGNVREWCADWYGGYPLCDLTDPTGAASGNFRVRRGGGWSSIAKDCRSANRAGISPSVRSNDLGFRVACSARPCE